MQKTGSLFAQPPSTFMSEIDALRDSIEALVEFIETSDVLREKLTEDDIRISEP